MKGRDTSRGDHRDATDALIEEPLKTNNILQKENGQVTMMEVSRRNFIGTAALGAAALTATAQISPTEEADIFYAKDDWNAAAFRKLLRERRQIKQIFDVTKPDGENLALHIHNALTGLERGFGISSDEICMVAALRSEANILNFNDYVWKKYRLGELFKINDPTTGKPAERNIYYPSHSAQNGKYATDDPNDPRSIDQDTSIASVQQLGVQLLCCHVATEGEANCVVKQLGLKENQETVARDMLAHTLPGVLVVPSMVSAIPVLETQGKFTYLRL